MRVYLLQIFVCVVTFTMGCSSSNSTSDTASTVSVTEGSGEGSEQSDNNDASDSSLSAIQRFSAPQIIHVGGATTVQWGDLDSDGDEDLVMAEGGKHHQGEPLLSWFEAPEWVRHNIGTPLTPFTGDSQVVDVDSDGDLDFVVSVDSHSVANNTGQVLWYENNGSPKSFWEQHIIEKNIPNAFHIGDVASGDVDGDGLMDVVVRHLSSYRFIVYFQKPGNQWFPRRITTRHREGLAIFDLNKDGLLDIVANGYAHVAPTDPRTGIWKEVIIDPVFHSQEQRFLNNSVKINWGDMNGDGKIDIIISPAEGEETYLAWYEIPDDIFEGAWKKHIIESPLRNNHQVQLADIDLDGDLDLFGGFAFKDVGVVWWENSGNGQSFERRTISETNGCYSCRAGDFDGDGDWDLAGPSKYVGTVYLYENMTQDHAGSFID